VTGTAGQSWDADAYARTARFVSDLGVPLVDLLAPRPGERVLDLGCGDGALTQELARRGADVVGVDASPSMVAAARRRGLDARLADGQDLAFDAEFDAVFSNAAIHWMPRQAAVVAGVRRALRPRGRFVAEFGGDGNVQAIREALHAELARRDIDAAGCDPWTFPTARAFGALLADVGFVIDAIGLIPRPTPLGGHLADWLDVFAGAFLAMVPVPERVPFKDAVAARAAPALRAADGVWSVDYVRLHLVARLT